MLLLLCKIKRDYSNCHLRRTFLCVCLLIESLANLLPVPIDKTRTCQVNCQKLLHYVTKATYFVNILKVLV